jgi:peptidyl-prolyl cis-trans isomerase A (cyclophilin A)
MRYPPGHPVMTLLRFLFGLLFLAAGHLGMAQTLRVVMATDLGEIELELFAGQAPGTVENFLRYVDGGFYDGGVFHRTVTPENQPGQPIRIEVIQAGINPARDPEDGPPIALERTRDTGLRHHDGAISMARLEPDSATSDFFICIGDQPELDFGGRRNADGQGFAAFGRVVRGMEVVRAIQRAPSQMQKLIPPVKIHSIRRLAP